MAVAGIIGTAVGVILLIVVAYVVVGATLTRLKHVKCPKRCYPAKSNAYWDGFYYF